MSDDKNGFWDTEEDLMEHGASASVEELNNAVEPACGHSEDDLLSEFTNQDLNLEILAEEAAEIIQIKSKIVRFGLDDYQPSLKLANRLKLEEEIGHFLAMVDILKYHGVITQKGIENGRVAKIKKLPKWYR